MNDLSITEILENAEYNLSKINQTSLSNVDQIRLQSAIEQIQTALKNLEAQP